MVICPIAIAVGCKKCPAFGVCPLKTVIGDYRPDEHSSGATTIKDRPAKSRAKRRKQ